MNSAATMYEQYCYGTWTVIIVSWPKTKRVKKKKEEEEKEEEEAENANVIDVTRIQTHT